MKFNRIRNVITCCALMVFLTGSCVWAGTLTTVKGTAVGNAPKRYLKKEITSNCTYLKAKNTGTSDVLELRKLTGQKMEGYDTVQGSCSDGTYGYFLMYNRTTNKGKIAKVNLNKKKLLKISKALPLGHGNDMTYNSKTKTLVVANSYGNQRTLSVVNASSLKMSKAVHVKIPSKLKNATTKQRKAITDFTAICYSKEKNQYMLKVKGTRNMLLVDSSFRPLKYIEVNAYNTNTDQNMECKGHLIFRSQSGSNLITAYDWSGGYRYKINLNLSGEIESVFFRGKTMFASVYRSYYKTEKKIVWVKKHGIKVPTIKKVKILVRDNYVVKVKQWRYINK